MQRTSCKTMRNALQWLHKGFRQSPVESDPERAYDLWAAGYDNQPENLVLFLETGLFAGLVSPGEMTGKIIYDVGCGTGRHWPNIISSGPAAITGFDVSEEMLQALRRKHPGYALHKIDAHLLPAPDESCDLLVSTLALAHIADGEAALSEWYRVLRPGGQIILTDYHPTALGAGANRTFRHKGKLFAVKNFIHPVDRLLHHAEAMGLQVKRREERQIDASVRGWYERQHALHVYERFRGTPILYGVCLSKACVAA